MRKPSKILVRVTGADIGNNSTKTDQGVCFPSKVLYGDDLENNPLAIKVKWRDEYYLVGETKEGSTFQDTDKINSEEYMVCLLTSIGLSYPEGVINTIVSLGVPSDYYSNLKDDYREKILELQDEEITFFFDAEDNEGVTKYINVVDCVINREGDLEDYIEEDEFDAMVVDFGGGTLDSTLYVKTSKMVDGKRVATTLPEFGTEKALGFDKVLDKIKNELASMDLIYDTYDQLILALDNECKSTLNGDVNIKEISGKVIDQFAKRVYSFLKRKKANTCKCFKFIGGCAEVMADAMDRNNLISKNRIEAYEDSQFFNAFNYKNKALKKVDPNKFEVMTEEEMED